LFDGQMLRLELGVTRLDEIKPNTQLTGRRLPGLPGGTAAGGRDRSHQPHATDRNGTDPGRRGEVGAAAR
jgi:hypothetical protein